MLIETMSALYNKLKEINNDENVTNVCKEVKVLTSEKYQEVIANSERNTDEAKVPYPIIVIYDNEAIEYDSSRFLNDEYTKSYRVVEDEDGNKTYYSDIYKPLLPYKLNYRIEFITKQRKHTDTIMLWIMRNIPDKYVLKVPFKDDVLGNQIYDAYYKRGNIIKADEGTSSTLYRRTFELQINTLIEDNIKESAILVSGTIVNGIKTKYVMLDEKEGESNG